MATTRPLPIKPLPRRSLRFTFPSTSTTTFPLSTRPPRSPPPLSFPFPFPFPRYPIPLPSPSPSPSPPPPPVPDNPSLGDCLVFDDDAFDDPFHPHHQHEEDGAASSSGPDSLVPERWREAVAEINLTKKEKRKIRLEQSFGTRVLKKPPQEPPAVMRSPEYLAFREARLPVDPVPPPEEPRKEEAFARAEVTAERAPPRNPRSEVTAERAPPRNPRSEVRGKTLDSIRDYFSNEDYVPGGESNEDKQSKGSRKLFTKEEKVLLNKKVPSLADATSEKWLPLHALVASGDFVLTDAILKYDADINAVDADGLCAIHKAVLGKKQAILNYLLRESVNPFVRDSDGATLMHYAVITASSLGIKTLLLYNVDINLPDDDGWTPLHLAVQSQRTDIVKLLLIKGADRTLRNKDGLTPLDLCLYSGRSERIYEIIKLLKEPPK